MDAAALASPEQRAFLGRLEARVAPAVLEARGSVVPEPALVWDDDGEDHVAPDLAILLRVPPPPRGEKLRTCPDIVVEVLREGERDLVARRELYLRRGALEYWIVDLTAKTVLRLSRASDACSGDAWWAERLGAADRLSTPLLPRGDVLLTDLFD